MPFHHFQKTFGSKRVHENTTHLVWRLSLLNHSLKCKYNLSSGCYNFELAVAFYYDGENIIVLILDMWELCMNWTWYIYIVAHHFNSLWSPLWTWLCPRSHPDVQYVLSLMIMHTFISLLSDIDECSDGTHNCSYICTNTNGSFICDCNYGFQLYFDGATCYGMQ